ncbi:ABC transporter permease [Prosthecomicrobium pneumaticum]|uniref:Polar amino acid transport system permease protein n=1 Tax=Prosthecomicrobium pneumaticum TaxID=81895 RepID=A0A7W9L3J3_9HYPH|nr:ABC transporter permease [Prosthecomicrobium pneumaticum]MBB5754611.1 polar amino acid transport system permease protein [Prosthecomicrobium pneumaticum]
MSLIDLDLLARYGPRLLSGLWVTLQLVALSVAIGALLAFPLAFARKSPIAPIRWASFGYSYFFRGTPLLAQTFLVYYGAGQFRPELQAVGLWWLFRDAFFCCALTFTLNTAAYQAEILRGALAAVPTGQVEAGMALGLSRWRIFRHIVLPQALVVALRPFGNEIILMVKGSAVAAIVTVFDLMGATRLAYARSFDFQVYLWAAVLYLAVVETLRRVWDRLERRMTRHLRPGGA